jgi:hypothetical protein
MSALLHLPARLFAEVTAAGPTRRRKQLGQMTIAIEILTFAPMRIANLVSLQLGVNFRESR